MVEVGLSKPISISDVIPPKTRVTLHFPKQSFEGAEAVDPAAPRTEAGYYWGFQIRKCSSLSNIFTESPWEGGYDLSVGTSERGLPASRVFPPHRQPTFNHLLIVFGGPRGLEYAAMNDAELAQRGIGGVRTRELFDNWVNILPNQGSRTIRTDEAVFIGLSSLRRLWSDS